MPFARYDPTLPPFANSLLTSAELFRRRLDLRPLGEINSLFCHKTLIGQIVQTVNDFLSNELRP